MSQGRKWGERNWWRYIYLQQIVVESGAKVIGGDIYIHFRPWLILMGKSQDFF